MTQAVLVSVQSLNPWCLQQALIAAAAQPSELRAWHVHSHRHRIEWSMRTLAAFAAAAATEDKKGIIHDPPQADCPDVATVLAVLLSAQLVLKVAATSQRMELPVSVCMQFSHQAQRI